MYVCILVAHNEVCVTLLYGQTQRTWLEKKISSSTAPREFYDFDNDYTISYDFKNQKCYDFLHCDRSKY